MLKNLRKAVCEANKDLPRLGLVCFTWGNVSGIDRKRGLVVIKPSGVAYKDLTPEDMVILDLTGNVIEGKRKPSSDTPTHLRLYEAFPEIGGVTHTHSMWATIFAQAGRGVAPFGTTHADYFHGPIPCTRALTEAEIAGRYEWETGSLIAETFTNRDPMALPAVLVKNHGPFTWGATPEASVHHAAVLENIAQMAYHTRKLNPKTPPVPQALLDKHYKRKHGPDAYYGQGDALCP
ncbi:MAG: L-ribulose-5-phosphate 4-epimerase [Defluviitaleaceae bacterium]|nr:L-ribulose-5-phosphate 4-epimerase [Defluviitaleaceae bacterium]MCL2240391.1 L-ribulose-5-phosphate 4-epimerase [Defluviitaleaceae bacterium]